MSADPAPDWEVMIEHVVPRTKGSCEAAQPPLGAARPLALLGYYPLAPVGSLADSVSLPGAATPKGRCKFML